MHETDAAAEFLGTLPPFDGLDEAQLRRAARGVEVAYYRAGQEILRSDLVPGTAVIRKGAVRLLDGKRRFLDQRSEGEVFGHPAWFHGEQIPYVAEAEEDCLVWHLPAEPLQALKLANEAFAAWFDRPPERRLSEATATAASPLQVADLLRRDPVSVDRGTSIRETAERMRDERVSSVLVMQDGELAGVLTDKDLRRRVLAAGVDPARPVGEVMTSNPTTLDAHSDMNDALLLMMRRGYHHLPVLRDGKAVGLVTAGDLLRAQSEHPLRLLQDIERQRSLDGLLDVSTRLPSLFRRTVSLGRTAEQVGRMITQVTDAFTVRLVQLAEADLGPAPVPWAWMAFGSQGRQEQTAVTDQDNGLLTAGPVDGEDARWFEQLARRVCNGLDRLGYVYCPGEIMALNPKWRVSLAAWKAHFDHWIAQPGPKSVMHCSIFFDLRCVHGEAALVDELVSHAFTGARDNRIFRRFMAMNALRRKPPIGFFRRFVQEEDGSRVEGLNLKHRGIVPLIDLVRLRALESGVTDPNTYRRIRGAVQAGAVNRGDAASLEDALNLVSRVRLDYQAAQLARGEPAGNLVPVEVLSPLMRRNLKAAFMMVREAQQALTLRYQVR